MSEPDNFLSRWSRRKLEPSKDSSETVAPDTKQPAEAQPAAVESQAPATPVSVSAPDQTPEPPFDLASLPAIESITAGTDIRDFLKPGVPLSLSRAALRRAWTSDPAIRDFVGLAENQWDFTNDSIAGFGPLDPADVPRLLARILGSSKDSAEASAALTQRRSEVPQSAPPETAIATNESRTATDRENVSTDPGNASTPEKEEQSFSAATTTREGPPRNEEKENDAAQNSDSDEKLNYAQTRNGHGSALPN